MNLPEKLGLVFMAVGWMGLMNQYWLGLLFFIVGTAMFLYLGEDE